ncbi:hypothetical protein ACP275_07G066000 [Erythranthe tilingii]
MILPLFKLGTLALRTLCKPIGNRIKKEAGFHPKFRQTIINIAQANHRLTTNLQRRIYSRATNVEIRPLNEEKAVQVAADLLGELFLFTVAGGLIVFEVQRNSRSEARKEELRKQILEVLRERDEELAGEIEQLKQRMAALELHSIFRFRHSKGSDDKTNKEAQPS